MVRAKCPNCGTMLRGGEEWAGKVGQCPHCQADVAFPAIAPQQVSTASGPTGQNTFANGWAAIGEGVFGFERDKSKPRFPALRIIARSYEYLAILVVVLAALTTLGVIIATVVQGLRSGGLPLGAMSIVVIPFVVFLGVIIAATITIWLLSAAQMIRLFLQIEQNTRDSYQELASQSDKSRQHN